LTPPGRLVMMTAMYRLGLNLGTTATPLLGAALLSVSYNLLFWGEALAALIYGVIALVALPRRVRATATATDTQASTESAPAGRRGQGYLSMLADWRFSFFLLAMFLISAVYCQYTA